MYQGLPLSLHCCSFLCISLPHLWLLLLLNTDRKSCAQTSCCLSIILVFFSCDYVLMG
nr:MAG TPA: hypothetical protein [Crassvirales sp.]